MNNFFSHLFTLLIFSLTPPTSSNNNVRLQKQPESKLNPLKKARERMLPYLVLFLIIISIIFLTYIFIKYGASITGTEANVYYNGDLA